MEIVLAWIVVAGMFAFGVVPLVASMLTGDGYWVCVKAGNLLVAAALAALMALYVVLWALNAVAISIT